jgi:peptide/nickel transport system substrate-binding protein
MIPDVQTQIAEIMAGGLDMVVMPLPPEQAAQFSAFPAVQVKAAPTMRALFLTFDTTETTKAPALRDERVRRAIMHAIDRETMVTSILGEGAEVLNGVCLPSQFGCPSEGVPIYEYNPEKAKALLAEAGYADGFDVEFYAYRERTLTESMLSYLQAVGIRAKLNFLQYAAFREQYRAGNAPIGFQTWASYMINDVSALTPIFFKNTPDDLAKDPEVHALLETGDTSGDPAVRQEAYGKAIALIQERAYALPISTMPNYFLAASDLDFIAHPDETPRFWEIVRK